MAFEVIDPVITSWAERNGFHVLTKYQDSDVRSMILATELGERYQLWIDPPDRSLLELTNVFCGEDG